MTDNTKPQPGDTVHVLAGGILLFGQAYRRGDTFTGRARPLGAEPRPSRQ